MKTLTTGMILTAIGLFIRYQIARRRFNRRTINGLQQFPSYHRFMLTVIIERVIYIIGTLCLWAGLALLSITALEQL
jgi:hypothetical protein